MPTRYLMLAALMAGLSTAACAEDLPAAGQAGRDPAPSSGAMVIHFDSMTMDPRTGITTMRVMAARRAPYSARVVTERLQTLADGNQIAARHSTMTYRDSAGRMRQEVRNANGEVVLVTINDPVASQNLVLRPQKRTATRIGGAVTISGANAQSAAAGAARIGQTAKDGAMPRVQRRRFEDGSEEIIVREVPRAGDSTADQGRDIRVEVPKALVDRATAQATQPDVALPVAGPLGDARWAANAVTKDLGTRTFDGVKAEGKLRSYEIPAGAIGNRAAITVSDETWTAPELLVTVYAKHSDPRSGDFVFRLEDIKREEPAAELFEVPADYTMKVWQGPGQAKVVKTQ